VSRRGIVHFVSHSLLTLEPGRFIGDACRTLKTEWFSFAETKATLSGRDVPPHIHTSSHFLAIVKGAYITEAPNRKGACGPGTVIFTPMGTAHHDRFQSPGGCFLTITPNADIARQLDDLFPVPMVCDIPGIRKATVDTTESLRRNDAVSRAAAEGAAFELIAQLTPPWERESRHPPSWVMRARSMIADCCTTEISVYSLAKAVDVHPIHLARVFRRHFFLSPAEYLRRCRIQKARQLILDSSLPLADVAAEVGFSDQSHFTNAFKRETGMTPGVYRRLRG
jgi:AraC family transcriptional regulator